MYSFLGTYLHRVFAGEIQLQSADHGVRNRFSMSVFTGKIADKAGKCAL